jgi:hypothetical protein
VANAGAPGRIADFHDDLEFPFIYKCFWKGAVFGDLSRQRSTVIRPSHVPINHPLTMA